MKSSVFEQTNQKYLKILFVKYIRKWDIKFKFNYIYEYTFHHNQDKKKIFGIHYINIVLGIHIIFEKSQGFQSLFH